MDTEYDRWLEQHDAHCRRLRRIERWLWRTLAVAALAVLAVVLYLCAVVGAMPLWLAMPALVCGTLLVAVAWQIKQPPTEEDPQ